MNVAEAMERIQRENEAVPQRIKEENEGGFILKALKKWAYDNKVTLDISSPGKPNDNSYIKSFLGSLRDDCQNAN
jgi:putative transposase